MKKFLTDWIPITKLKEEFILIEFTNLKEFNDAAKNESLNPSQVIFEDREKTYFHDSSSSKKTYYLLVKERFK